MALNPESAGFGEDAFGALAAGFGFGEEHEHFFDGEGDGDVPQHFILHPRGDGIDVSLPFVDGGGGAIAEVFGEGFAGESALFAEVSEGFVCHVR